jgi:hypothetical protein
VADFEMPEPTRLMVAGDWHHATHWGVSAIRHAKFNDCDAILHVGDFGYWPAWDEVTQTQLGTCVYTQRLRQECEEQGIPLYWLCGNHENHRALYPGQGDQWLRHLPRGHRWQWWNKTWMSVGGGVSVNYPDILREGFDYFPEEELTQEQLEHCLRPGAVDIVIAHDAPTGVDIPGVHAIQKQDRNSTDWPRERLDASWAHRGLLSQIADAKDPYYWFHGHYHVRYNAERGPVTKVIGLDCNGPLKNRDHNIVILTPEDLK